MDNIRLLVTDLDNTLLHRDGTISSYTANVLQRISQKGVLVAFATARDFRFVSEHLASLCNITPDIIIADNGALARFNNMDIYKRMIIADTANVLIQHFRVVRSIATENNYYLSNEFANNHWSIGKKSTVITDFAEGMNCDVFMLMAI